MKFTRHTLLQYLKYLWYGDWTMKEVNSPQFLDLGYINEGKISSLAQ